MFGNIFKKIMEAVSLELSDRSGRELWFLLMAPTQYKNDTKNKYANTALNYTKFEYVTK